MANEITVSVRLAVKNGSYVDAVTPPGLSLTQNAIGASAGVLEVTTGGVNLPTTNSITTPGLLFLMSLTPYNIATEVEDYVSYGPNVSGVMKVLGRLKQTEIALIRLDPSVTLTLTANTTTTNVQYLLLED